MNITQCLFLSCFGQDFSRAMTFPEAMEKTGPHVYLFIAPRYIKYAKGYSQIAYIGYTDTPKTRFSGHHRKEQGDSVMMLPLASLLRAVKDNFHNWRRTSARDKRSTAENMERVFLYLFKRMMGELPDRNVRKDLPTSHMVAVLAEFILESRNNGTATTPSSKPKATQKTTKSRPSPRKETPKKTDLSTGNKIASVLLSWAPSKFSTPRRRDANDRRIIKHGDIHVLRIRVHDKHCRVQVRSKCAFEGRSRSTKVTGQAWHEEWHLVDSETSIQKVVNLLVKEWG